MIDFTEDELQLIYEMATVVDVGGSSLPVARALAARLQIMAKIEAVLEPEDEDFKVVVSYEPS